jgi:hypothetical protein
VIEFLETLQKESELDTEEAINLLTNILKFSEYTSKHLKEAMSLTRVMELQAYEGSSSPSLIDLNQLVTNNKINLSISIIFYYFYCFFSSCSES